MREAKHDDGGSTDFPFAFFRARMMMEPKIKTCEKLMFPIWSREVHTSHSLCTTIGLGAASQASFGDMGSEPQATREMHIALVSPNVGRESIYEV